MESNLGADVIAMVNERSAEAQEVTAGEVPDNVMWQAAHLYQDLHAAAERSGTAYTENPTHAHVECAKARGRFEGYFDALWELGYFRFNGFNETPYRALELWLFRNGMMNGQQTLGGWAKSLGKLGCDVTGG